MSKIGFELVVLNKQDNHKYNFRCEGCIYPYQAIEKYQALFKQSNFVLVSIYSFQLRCFVHFKPYKSKT